MENKVLAGLEAEKKARPEYVKAVAKRHSRSRLKGLGLGEIDSMVSEDSEATSRCSTVPRTDSGTSSKNADRTSSMLSAMRLKNWRRQSSSVKAGVING